MLTLSLRLLSVAAHLSSLWLEKMSYTRIEYVYMLFCLCSISYVFCIVFWPLRLRFRTQGLALNPMSLLIATVCVAISLYITSARLKSAQRALDSTLKQLQDSRSDAAKAARRLRRFMKVGQGVAQSDLRSLSLSLDVMVSLSLSLCVMLALSVMLSLSLSLCPVPDRSLRKRAAKTTMGRRRARRCPSLLAKRNGASCVSRRKRRRRRPGRRAPSPPSPPRNALAPR
jgi:hypothetical protein